MMLPFFHRPKWCIEAFEHKPEYQYCGFNYTFATAPAKGTYKQENDIDYVGYPSSNIPKIETFTESRISIVCYALLMYFTLIRLFLKVITRTAKLRTIVITGLLGAMITSHVAKQVVPWYWGGLHEQIGSFFSLMFFVRSLRDSWKRIITVMFDSLGIMTMIISYICFFTLLGYVLFDNDYY